MKTQKWIKLLNRKSSLAFSASLIYSNEFLLKKRLEISIRNFWYDNLTDSVCYIEEELQSLGNRVNRVIQSDNKFVSENAKECKISGKRLLLFTKKFLKIAFSKISNRTLADLLKSFNQKYCDSATLINTTQRHALRC